MTNRLPVLLAALAAASIGCTHQKVEPQVASSTAQTHYAVLYPDHLQATANDYVNTEGDVRRITADFTKYPGQLKDPPWPLVVTIVNRADEVERYRESLGKANATALEKQTDDISEASYAAFIRATELRARTTALIEEASQIRKTLDQSIAEERAFQAEAGRAAGDKKASVERMAKMEDAKVRVDRTIPSLQNLEKDIEQRNAALKKEYNDALEALRKALESKATSK
jgi:hypothetical protein